MRSRHHITSFCSVAGLTIYSAGVGLLFDTLGLSYIRYNLKPGHLYCFKTDYQRDIGSIKV